MTVLIQTQRQRFGRSKPVRSCRPTELSGLGYWTQTFFKGIALFKSSSEKDACFSCERCQFLPFFDYSDMSLKSSNYFNSQRSLKPKIGKSANFVYKSFNIAIH
ncbi:hypothetical protein BpHYR1_044362 [Brachionus plicatilis]|uniref:Uncharacterized protein n=1 Tax=Brachionus plicatilis TaxID=10195 RepID=A0A3M7SSY1_BRAPC|nr:hypothetical protein BpHYR1_044362 [Brachionus plicatilis]